jgi:hypothetical protein
MLLISLLAMMTGCVLLYLILDKYPSTKPNLPPDRPAAQQPAGQPTSGPADKGAGAGGT